METFERPAARIASGVTQIKIPPGRALEHFARDYPDVARVIYELIGNEVDEGATWINITINYSSERTLVLTGNGIGTDADRMNEAMVSVTCSLKGTDKYGQHGLGFFSPYGKCEYFTFTSLKEGDEPRNYRTWKFDESLKEKGVDHVTWVAEHHLLYWPDENLQVRKEMRHLQRVPWRTRIEMVGITKDKRLSKIDLDEIVSELGRRYREKIQERDIQITIRFTDERGVRHPTRKVVPTRYTGRELDVATFSNIDAGATEFKLFIANKGPDGRNGVVEFSTKTEKTHLRNRVKATDFFRCVDNAGIPLDRHVKEALLSGTFEGEIVAEKMKSSTNRVSFIADDALIGFCDTLEQWFGEVGSKHYEKVIREAQDVRLSKLGEETIGFIKLLSKCNPTLFHELSTILPKGDDIGGNKGEKEKDPKPPEPGPKKPTPDPKPRPEPDPKRKKIKRRLGGSSGDKVGLKGLHIEYVELENTRDVFDFDVSRGTIYVNIFHPYRVYCDTSDARLRQYLIAVAQTAVIWTLYEGKPEEQIVQKALMYSLGVQVLNIVNQNPLTGGTGAFREIDLEIG